MSTYVTFITFFMIEAVVGDVQVYFASGMGQMVADFQDLPAAFGEQIPAKGITAFVVYSSPDEQACSRIDPPPRNISNYTKHWAVLIKRYNCTFEEKILAAQNASFNLAIVYNTDSDDLKRMHANNPEKIYIPSVFIGERAGFFIKERYLYDKGFLLKITEESPIDFNTSMLIPFLVVITLCLLSMIGFLVVKYIKERRRAGRRRLPNSSLRKIPTAKYRKGDPYETCAICLDDYIEGEKLRILPCSHAYHSKCIDPWLTKNRRICPMCKRKVYAAGEQISSDTDSASEDDDQTPLLRSAQQTHGGTFRRNMAAALGASSAVEDIVQSTRPQLYNTYEGYHDDTSSASSYQSEPIENNQNSTGQNSNNPSTTQSWMSPSRSALNGSSEDVNPFSSSVCLGTDITIMELNGSWMTLPLLERAKIKLNFSYSRGKKVKKGKAKE